MTAQLKIHYLAPKIYVGGWYVLKNPFNHVPLTVGNVVVVDMFNLYLN